MDYLHKVMMEERKFPLGARVKLKSGSIVMVVVDYTAKFADGNKPHVLNFAVCRWSEGKLVKEGSFCDKDLEFASTPLNNIFH